MKRINNTQLRQDFLIYTNNKYGKMSGNYRCMNINSIDETQSFDDITSFSNNYFDNINNNVLIKIVKPGYTSENNKNSFYSKAFNCYEIFVNNTFSGKLMIASTPDKLLRQAFIKETLTMIFTHLMLKFKMYFNPFRLSTKISTDDYKNELTLLIDKIKKHYDYLSLYIDNKNINRLLKILDIELSKIEFSSTDVFLTTYNNSLSQAKGLCEISKSTNSVPYINKNIFLKLKRYGANLSGYKNIDKWSTMDLILISNNYDINNSIKNLATLYKSSDVFNNLFTNDLFLMTGPFVGISLKENEAKIGKWKSMYDYLWQPINKKLVLDKKHYKEGIPIVNFDIMSNDEILNLDRSLVSEIQSLCKKYHNINYIYKKIDNIDWDSKDQTFNNIHIKDMRAHFINSVKSHLNLRWLLSFDTNIFGMGIKWSMSINNNCPDIFKLTGDKYGYGYNIELNDSSYIIEVLKDREFRITDCEWKQTKNIEFFVNKSGDIKICDQSIYPTIQTFYNNISIEVNKFKDNWSKYC